MNALELFGDPDISHVEVDVLPTETQGLALAKTHGQGKRVESFESITFSGVEQHPRLVRREGLELVALNTGPSTKAATFL